MATTSGNQITLSATDTHFTLTGSSPFDITGNELNNRLIGNTAINHLYGEQGNDTLEGGDGDDRLMGETANDILRGGKDEDQLEAHNQRKRGRANDKKPRHNGHECGAHCNVIGVRRGHGVDGASDIGKRPSVAAGEPRQPWYGHGTLLPRTARSRGHWNRPTTASGR